jgi:hypothetical protein
VRGRVLGEVMGEQGIAEVEQDAAADAVEGTLTAME